MAEIQLSNDIRTSKFERTCKILTNNSAVTKTNLPTMERRQFLALICEAPKPQLNNQNHPKTEKKTQKRIKGDEHKRISEEEKTYVVSAHFL